MPNPMRMVCIVGLIMTLVSCSAAGVEITTSPSTTMVSSVPGTTGRAASTSMPATTLDLTGITWVTHGLDGVRAEGATLIWETHPVPAAIARDRLGGLVFSDSAGLWWYRDGESEPERVGDGSDEVLAAWMAEEGPTAILRTDGSNAISLRDGVRFDPPADAPVEVLGESPWLRWTSSNGLSAWITDPEVEFDSEGQPSKVVETARLVVARDERALVDVSIAPFDRAWARIHDFDGQRVIVSRGPFEPAMPAESFLLVDLATGEVTEIFEAAATNATFTGADREWTGPVRTPELANSD